MTTPLYAICFAPEQGSALDAVGRTWFADGVDRGKLVPGLQAKRLDELTRTARNYGLHGTFKPPFELMPHTTEAGLLRVAEVIAERLAPIELPPLELGEIGFIVSLVPESSSAPLENLAASCVRAFDGYRRPVNGHRQELYNGHRLTVHQKQMYLHWGYPYVMEEFDFHISLTDQISDADERMAVMTAMERIAAPVLGKPLTMRELAVFRQDKPAGPMSIIARIPFGRS